MTVTSQANLPERLRPQLPDLAMVALLLGLSLLFFWRIITPNPLDRAAFAKGDFTEQFYAFAYFKAQEINQGRFPLWNPYTYSGHPFLADIQSAVFYPLSLLTILLARPWGYPLIALELETVLHFFLASLFTYLLGRRLFQSRFGALVAAVTFAYGGYLTSYPIQQTSLLEVVVWLPLILLLIDYSTDPSLPGRRRTAFTSLAGLALGLSILAGHPKTALEVTFASLAYFLYKATREAWGAISIRSGIVPFLRLPLFLAIASGLAAVQLLPTYEFSQLSTRIQISYSFAYWGFPLHDILQMILPGSVSLYSPMYVGILPLTLAILAILRRRDPMIPLWVGLALASLLISFGGHTFLYGALRLALPGFNLFRNQETVIHIFSLSMAILAGYGASLMAGSLSESFQRDLERAYRILLWSIPGALVLFILISYAQVITGKFSSWLDRSSFLLILLVLVTGLFRLRLHRAEMRPALQLGAVALVLFDLFSVNWSTNVAEAKPEDYYAPGPLVQVLLSETGLFRTQNGFWLPGNYGDVYQVADTGGASPLKLERYYQLLNSLPRERVWQLLNVKYFVTWEGGLDQGLQHLVSERAGEDEAHLYRLQSPLPRAYIVHRAVVEQGEGALKLLASSAFDPRSTVLLEEEPPVTLTGSGSGPSRVESLDYRPGSIQIRAELADDGVLVLSENYYPGWRAFVDGREERLYRANYTLMALPLAKGSHQIELIFDPTSFKVGLLVSAIALFVSLGLILGGVKGREPRTIDDAS